MTRRYDEPIDVRRRTRDDEPAQFLWRGRVWVVRAVLAHWMQTGAWWQTTALLAAADGSGRGTAPGRPGADRAAGRAARQAGDSGGDRGGDRAGGTRGSGAHGSAGSSPADSSVAGVAGSAGSFVADLTAERELWRVEATRGRQHGMDRTGVFDLCFDWAGTDRPWTLVAALD